MEDKKGDHEKEDDGEDNNIVKYGGFVGEGETDEVVERVAKKKVKKVKDENMIKFTDCQIQDDGRQPGEKNWTTKHLPSVAAKAFEDQVVPMMRMKAGLLPPWETPTMRDLQATMDKHSLHFELNTRLNGWRRSFVEAAEGSIKKVISDHSKNLDTTAKIAELMTYYLSNTSDEEDEESRVFHWKDLDSETGTKSGFLASDVITRTLGVAYLSKFPEFLTDLSESKPVGTLVLATQAVEHMLEQWTTGCIVKSTKEISADSYKKYEGLLKLPEEPGKPKTYAQKIIHRTNFFMENIEVFKEHHLKTILDEALHLMPEKWQKKRGVAISKAASQDEISIVDTQSNTRHRRIVVVD
ncbi:hypothetical protein F5887DRAFT_1076476 [Amanita rubescens]|nr:hypothetical protein F5887DRAFT_1076476 [Amanita rubescens]